MDHFPDPQSAEIRDNFYLRWIKSLSIRFNPSWSALFVYLFHRKTCTAIKDAQYSPPSSSEDEKETERIEPKVIVRIELAAAAPRNAYLRIYFARFQIVQVLVLCK